MRLNPLGRAFLLLPAFGVGACAIEPEPLTTDDLKLQASTLVTRVVADQEDITRSIDVFEAMARALKYNLDHKVEIYDEALRAVELRAAHAGMLPTLVSNAGLANRDNHLASSSFNLVTNAPNFGFSTSQDQRGKTADIVFGWHILDFGLSYVRAQQAADKVLISAENRRKVMHRVIEEVRAAYWKAVSAERLDARLRSLESRVRRALGNARSLARGGETSPIAAVTYRRELIEVQRTVQELRRELSLARHQLAALMNVKPGTSFRISLPPRSLKTTGSLGLASDAMIEIALAQRPEIRDVSYRQRINRREATAAMLELLPGIQVYAGANYDHNSFLLNNDWVSWGARASWNVMKLFTHRERAAVIAAQDDLLDQRALALTMAIMTQIHVSRARYAHVAHEHATATDYLMTQRNLVGLLRAEHAAGKISEQTLLREELNELVAEVRADMMTGQVEQAKAAILTALGSDVVDPEAATNASIPSIASGLRRLWWQRNLMTSWTTTATVAR